VLDGEAQEHHVDPISRAGTDDQQLSFGTAPLAILSRTKLRS
jgi:hypothetical protein